MVLDTKDRAKDKSFLILNRIVFFFFIILVFFLPISNAIVEVSAVLIFLCFVARILP